MTSLPATYHPGDIEPAIYTRWLEADVFAPDGRGSNADHRQQPFVIIEPPPNVTGALHLGHAARASVEDLMIRRARMQGKPTLWLPGVDHASIAAQLVLDKIIAAEGESRETRSAASATCERMWQFMDETRGVISGQHRRLGVSVDWVARALHHGRGQRRRPCGSPSSSSTTTASRTAARSSSTGAPAAAPACRTWR